MYEDLDTSGEEFNWDEYLKTGGAEAAPASCFCQNRQPPPNEFKVGHKLETYDPRNTSSICIGSVIEVSGSRIRLRLDGTDDRNDFWLMVDSDLIHPFEHAAKHGRNIQPPLGFGNDLSKWPKFLEKIIHNAKENMFAPETCFKSPPPRPPKNEFKVGQKLEAVDPKNPHLVCPATVREVKLDKLLVAFDGWHQSSYFWCSYSSRDLFPVGWCKLSGHKLQRPGTLEDKISSKAAAAAANLSATSKLNANKSIAETPATAAATTAPTTAPTPVKKAKAKKSATASSEPPAAKKANLNTSNASADSSSSLLNVTTDENKSMAIVKPTTAKAPKRLTNRAVTSQADSTVATSSPQAPVDLSIIKTEALDPSESPILTNEVVKDKVILYVNPFGDCGKLIKNEPYHNAHLKFGPGTPPTIYRSVLQSFVDFAHNKPDFFNLVPVGKSDNFVKLKTPGISDKKKIPLIENEEEMWTSLRKFCDQIGINCDDFFNRNSYAPFHSTLKKKGTQPVGYSTPISNSKEKTQKASAAVSKSSAAAAVSSSNMPLTPQQTSSSSSASSSSSSSSSSTSSEVHTTVKKAHSSPKDTATGPAQKRHVNTNNDSLVSNSDHQPYHENGYSVAKVARFEQTFETLPVTDWSTDQVVDYLVSTGDVNFTSHVDMFRLQEIDGKAFLLLSTETLMKYMGFKLGPALKLNNFIDRLRRSGMAKPIMADQISSTTVPKVECQ